MKTYIYDKLSHKTPNADDYTVLSCLCAVYLVWENDAQHIRFAICITMVTDLLFLVSYELSIILAVRGGLMFQFLSLSRLQLLDLISSFNACRCLAANTSSVG